MGLKRLKKKWSPGSCSSKGTNFKSFSGDGHLSLSCPRGRAAPLESEEEIRGYLGDRSRRCKSAWCDESEVKSAKCRHLK